MGTFSLDSFIGLLLFSFILLLYNRNWDSDLLSLKSYEHPLKVSYCQHSFELPFKLSSIRSAPYSKWNNKFRLGLSYDLKLHYLTRHFRVTQVYFQEQRRVNRPPAIPGNNFEFPETPFQFMPPNVANLQNLPAVANALVQNAAAQQNQTSATAQSPQQPLNNLSQQQVASNSLGMVIDNSPPDLYSNPFVRNLCLYLVNITFLSNLMNHICKFYHRDNLGILHLAASFPQAPT